MNAEFSLHLEPAPSKPGTGSVPPVACVLTRVRRACVRILVPCAVLLLVWLVGGCRPSEPAGAGTARYHCPMHPTYVSDRPGDCPICNMKLVPIPGSGNAGAAASAAAPGAASESVPGRVAVAISAERRQLIGMRSTTVARREMRQRVRASATFEHDETLLARIAPRFGGWVQKLHVNFTGSHVHKGQPLLTVYSPELLAAENEYLVAWRRLRSSGTQADDPQQVGARALVESARRRLALWEIAEEDIRALEERGAPRDEAVIRSPVSGHVLAKTAVEGRSFAAGETLYEIADLSPIWLRAAVSEQDLPLVRTGQVAHVHVAYRARHSLESTVDFIYPHIDPVTRRAYVRIQLPNADHEFFPDMWAQVEIEASAGEHLAAPASAVIDTGTRSIAFVVRDDGHLEPREVTVGFHTDEFVEIQSGLEEGEEVVTRALFLIDSESQLKSALQGMSMGSDTGTGASAGGAHNHGTGAETKAP